MADIEAGTANRAQLLIVAAVGFAIVLTVLALTLNTAVYGEILASQADNGGHEERGAMQYQDTVQRGISGLLPIDAGNESGYDEVEARFEDDVARLDELTSAEYARDEVATTVSVTNVTFESWIVQNNASRTFQNQSGAPAWRLATDVSAVDTFEMTVQSDDLAPTDDCASDDKCFTLRVTGGNGTVWEMFVYTSAGDGHEIIVDGDVQKKTNDSSLTIDLVNGGLFDSETFVEDDTIDPPYTMVYGDTHNVTGTYTLNVTGKAGVDEDDFGATGSPRVDFHIVSATASLSYRSPQLFYRTERPVTPGENDG